MRKLMIAMLSLASLPSSGAGLKERMMSDPKVQQYLKDHPEAMSAGFGFMLRHPGIDSMGPAALNDPAIRKDIKDSGLTELMNMAMGKQKETPAAKAAPANAPKKIAGAPAPAAKTAPKAAAKPESVVKAAPKANPRLNTTYVVRKQAGLTAERQKGLSLNSPGIHLTGKTRQVAEEGGRKSNWLQVADAKGNKGWVNIGAKYNLGGARPTRVASASSAPPLKAPAPQSPPEKAPAAPQGPGVAELPAPKMPANEAPATPVTPTAQTTEEKAAAAATEPKPNATEVAKADGEVKQRKVEEKPADDKECASNSKDYALKPKLMKAFGNVSPFVSWSGAVPGITVMPVKDEKGEERYELELNDFNRKMAAKFPVKDPESKKRLDAMLAVMEKSPNKHAPFDFMVCVDGDGKDPYLYQLGNKQYFSKDRKAVTIVNPGLPDTPFTRIDEQSADAAQ